MKILKPVLLSLFIAASMGAVSTSALAETDAGRVTYKPAEAIDMTAGHVQSAIDALITGDADGAGKHIKAALDASKEINANDRVDQARSKANNMLKEAVKDMKEANNQGAETKLRAAHTKFLDLKGLI